MKWTKQQIKDGTIVYKEWFAWYPVRLHDTDTILWLEKVIVKRKYWMPGSYYRETYHLGDLQFYLEGKDI